VPEPVVRSSDGPAMEPPLPEFRLLPSTQSLLPVFTKPQMPSPKLQSKSSSSVKVPGRQRKRVGLNVGVLVGTDDGNGVGTGDGKAVGSGVGKEVGNSVGKGDGINVGSGEGKGDGIGDGCGVGWRVG